MGCGSSTSVQEPTTTEQKQNGKNSCSGKSCLLNGLDVFPCFEQCILVKSYLEAQLSAEKDIFGHFEFFEIYYTATILVTSFSPSTLIILDLSYSGNEFIYVSIY